MSILKTRSKIQLKKFNWKKMAFHRIGMISSKKQEGRKAGKKESKNKVIEFELN